MARKLASIQLIDKLSPIEGADRIEIASVQGWQAVVKKGDFSEGGKCIFCEVDSLLPDKPEFEFLHKSKYRIKTIRLRGQLSQGLCLTIDYLPIEYRELDVGTDITEIMGINKYEPPLPKSATGGQTKGSFPGYVPKTDEPRIQSNPGLLEEFRGVKFYTTVKIDGTSFTAAKLDSEIDICSRSRSVKEDNNNVYWRMARKYDIVPVLKHAGNIAVQGEIAGWWQEGRSTIQGNPLKLKESELFVFNVFDILEGRYYSFDELVHFCDYYRLQMVPVEHSSIVLNHTLEEILSLSRGNYDSGEIREGLVWRPLIEQASQVLKGRASFKAINNDYLLKHGDR